MRQAILNVVWKDKSALLPSEAAVTVGDVEVRKEGALLELTDSLRETVGEAASGGGGS